MMEEVNYNMLKKIYDDFEDRLLKSINNKDKYFFTQNTEDCYVIEESWYNEVSNIFKTSDSSEIPLPNSFSIFISDFKCIIELLKSEKKFRLINKKFIELLDRNENKLKNIPIINYYGGNNKIIIEYKGKKDDKALLIIDPLNHFSIINRTYIISIKNEDRLDLYNDLLSEENNSNIISKQKYKNFVITFQNYLNYNFIQSSSQTQNVSYPINDNNKNNTDENFKKEIIKILIYIFYNQNYLKDEKEKKFGENNYYYLISTDWLNKFLEYYDFSKLKQLLINISKSNPKININNLCKYINSYVEEIYKRNLINFEKEKNEDIFNIQKVLALKNKINNIFHFKKCNIFLPSIIFILNECIFQNKIKSKFKKKLYIKNKDIYFSDFNSIIIGNLNKELFIPKYILSYETNKVLKSELENFTLKEITDYMKSRNCDINNNNKIQNLINKNKIIGQLINLMDTISENNIPMKNNILNNKNNTINEKIPIVKKKIIEHPVKNRIFNTKEHPILSRSNTNSALSLTNNNNYNLTKKKNSLPNENLNDLTQTKNDSQLLNIENNQINIKTLLLNDQENTNKLNLYQKKLNDQQNEINNLYQKIKQLKSEVDNIKESKLHEKNNKFFKLNEIFGEKDNKIGELVNPNSDKKKDLKEQYENIINTEKDNQIHNLKKENFSIKNKSEELYESRKEDQDKSKDEKNNELKNKDKNLDDKKDNEILQKNDSKLEDLLKENKTLKESINSNKIEYNNLINKNNELNNQLLEIKQELISKNRESNSKEFDDLKKENLSLSFILNEKISEVDKLNKIISYMNKEKKSLENQKREIEKKERELQQKFDLLIQENNEIEKKRKEFQNELKLNEKIKQENNNLNIQNQLLLNEIQEKQNQLNELETSIQKTIKISVLSGEKCDTSEIIGYIEKNKKNNYNNIEDDNINNNYMEINNNKKASINPSQPPPLNSSPLRCYKGPPLIGLNNIGAAAFINAAIQCFSQTKDLTNYFLNPKNQNQIINNNAFINNRDEPQLSPIYLKLIQKLWPKNYDYNSFSPSVFINIVEKLNPLFKNGQSGDLKDFITFLLDQFHKELKKSKENNRVINNRSVTLNHYDKKETMNYFFEEFMKENSIISDLFLGIIETTTVCLNCKQKYNSRGMNNPIFYDYQKINCIIFPLEEVNNHKNSDMQSINFNYYMNQNNIVSIYDCFIFYQKTKILNQYFCKDCNQVNDSQYTTNIYSSPNILIIILDRGKNNFFNVKFEFTERIDITNFILAKEKPIIEYNLYGVITLIENSNRFIASCKSSLDNKWYRYNDSIVTPINDIRRDVIDFGTLYILFYQKI